MAKKVSSTVPARPKREPDQVTSCVFLGVLVAFASLVSCGGGGAASPAATSSGTISSSDDALAAVPSPNSAASTELVAVQSVANALQVLVAQGYFGAEAAALGRTIVATDISKFVDEEGKKIEPETYASFMLANCLDRNGTVEVTLPQAVIDDSIRLKKLSINGGVQSSNTYKNCKSNTSDAQGNTYYRYTNGTTTVSHRRYNSDSDYAYTVALNGLVLETIENGVTVLKTLSGANSCDTVFPSRVFSATTACAAGVLSPCLMAWPTAALPHCTMAASLK